MCDEGWLVEAFLSNSKLISIASILFTKMRIFLAALAGLLASSNAFHIPGLLRKSGFSSRASTMVRLVPHVSPVQSARGPEEE